MSSIGEHSRRIRKTSAISSVSFFIFHFCSPDLFCHEDDLGEYLIVGDTLSLELLHKC